MKKLMITLAAVAVAAGVQAANIDWGIAAKSFEMADGSHPNGQTVYLVNTSASSWSGALAAIAAGEITAANIEKQAYWAGTATTYYNADTSKTAFKNGYAKVTGAVGKGDGATLTLDKYALVIFDAATKTPDTYYIVTAAADGKGYESNPDLGSPLSFTSASFAADTSLSGGWAKVESVPEPTSGLLLLLGMAGLALRRRRA